MEEKKPKQTPTPGIPEAIHPFIGNGVAWEQNMHAFLLRNPDTAKQLDGRLSPDHTSEHEQLLPYDQDSYLPEPDLIVSDETGSTANEAAIQVKSGREEEVESKIADSSNRPSQSESIKLKRKKNPGKEEKSDQPTPPISEEPKRQKAGKLIKKAAKTVKRQEAEKNPLEPAETMIREITLSPYTKWLKGLAGSEYVHPYDEDYAFHQEGAAAGDGITETYADLLAAQGHKEQALEMYIRLMEKYPEKSSFFAAKIEALQQP